MLTFPRKPIRRTKNLSLAIYHQVRWHWRCYHFGWRSHLAKPDLITNSKGLSIGRRVDIWKGARLEAVGSHNGAAPKIEIGDNTIIHMYFHCGAFESVKIGCDVLIAGHVFISDHDHEFEDPGKPARWNEKLRSQPVIIEDGAWLGEGCVILKGVRVGKRAVVGANAVVTKDVPDFAVVAGVPAKVLRSIDTVNFD
jgi:acetyltransferase-like isoleucine patch superfamily enzyme